MLVMLPIGNSEIGKGVPVVPLCDPPAFLQFHQYHCARIFTRCSPMFSLYIPNQFIHCLRKQFAFFEVERRLVTLLNGHGLIILHPFFLFLLLYLRVMAGFEHFRHPVLSPLPHEHIGTRVDFRTRDSARFERFRFSENSRHEARYCIYKSSRRKLATREYVGPDGDLLRFQYLLYAGINTLIVSADKKNVFLFGKFLCHRFVELYAIGREKYLLDSFSFPNRLLRRPQYRFWL